jgi:putative transposase
MAEAYRISDQHAPYFITLTIIDWVDIFTRKEYKDIVVDSLTIVLKTKDYAYMST